MIKVNKKEVLIEKFPDGTPRINLSPIDVANSINDSFGLTRVYIEWLYETNDEIFYLILIKKHLETYLINPVFFLNLPYIPNARMDRIKGNHEVFTLKYFCDMINFLDFKAVYVLDAHSDVSVGLLNNCICLNANSYVSKAIEHISDEVILYFPDYGAAKRYANMFPQYMYCYGEKKRDWETGKILGLDVRTNGIDLTGKTVLMIDDIISYGGSLYYSALKLKDLGVNKLYAYATHTENSVLNKEKGTLIKALENNTVERLYTTNSLFRGQHEKIVVMEA